MIYENAEARLVMGGAGMLYTFDSHACSLEHKLLVYKKYMFFTSYYTVGEKMERQISFPLSEMLK